jgi:fluoroquinolone transport system ATP-binding protein
MIEVKELYHSYTHDDRYAVNGISFAVGKGEIFGFLGPNGAGKSTTQKILTGLLPLQKGTAIVAGEDVRSSGRALFNRIGVSFENPNNYRKLTGLENLQFFASLYDVPTADPMDLLRKVGLQDTANRRAGAYSRGMQARLVFARALLNKPELLFLDEPTGGLDPNMTQQVKELILAERERGATVVLTTHNMQVAEELSDRVAFLNEGRIAAIDTPRNLKLQYGERLVAIEYRTDGELARERLSMTIEADRARMRELLDSGKIETMHSQEASLEEVFIKITGRGLAG